MPKLLKPLKPALPPLIRMSDVTPRDMKWLWYPYIPIGAATMIFGKGGIGKSHIACAIASALSNGEGFPGTPEGKIARQKVLMMSAEDDLEVVLWQRLTAMGARMENIFAPPSAFILDPQGIKDTEEYIRMAAATVCFIDPIVHYMGGKVDMNRMNEVRAITGALHQMAQRTQTAIIIVHHSKKKGPDDVDYDELAAGSADFVNAVRSTLYVRKTNDGTRVMQHVKSNYAPEGPAISYSLGEDGFEWGDFVGDDQLIGAATRKSGPRDKARAFLKDLLSAGPVPATEVEARAQDEGIAKNTLGRAKDGLAESFVKKTAGGTHWYWRLKGDTRGVPDFGMELPSPKETAKEFLARHGLA